MAISYNLHFANYNMGNKYMTQFILPTMWKQMHINYQVIYFNLVFQKKL